MRKPTYNITLTIALIGAGLAVAGLASPSRAESRSLVHLREDHRTYPANQGKMQQMPPDTIYCWPDFNNGPEDPGFIWVDLGDPCDTSLCDGLYSGELIWGDGDGLYCENLAPSGGWCDYSNGLGYWNGTSYETTACQLAY